MSWTAYIVVIRPVNVLMTFVSVMVVLFVSTAGSMVGAWQPAVLAALSASLICAGANVINDVFDVEIDRINKPGRPVASGALTVRAARIYWMLLSVIGVTCSVWINWGCVSIALSAAVVLFAYSACLKQTPLWGNLTVSALTGLAFLYGGLAIGRLRDALWPALFSVLFHFGREILKDVEDIEGDVARGARTFPIAFGRTNALILTTAVFLAVMWATLIAFLTGFYEWPFMLVVGVTVYPVLVYSTWSMWRDTTPANLHRLNNMLKADMAAGVIAILVG